MTIWLLALVLLASLAALGYRQGAIRVGISFVGILVAACLAPSLGRLLKPVFMAVGVKNPILAWALGPLLVFIVISALFKVAAFMVHQKVDVFYKYRAGDLRLALWERLNARVGLCLGLLNGTAYLVLISFIIYCFGYWTVQIATSDDDPRSVKVLNRLAQDLQNSGFISVARSLDRLPESYYDAADVVGIVFNNFWSEARLVRYPGLLALGERPEFQDLGKDDEFSKLRASRAPISQLLEYPKVQAIVNNPDLLKLIWTTMTPDLKDLRTFLDTLQSPKYDSEHLYGRWHLDVNSALRVYLQSKQTLPSAERQKVKNSMATQYAKTIVIAMPGGQAVYKNRPRLAPGVFPSVATPVDQGHWQRTDGKYQFSFASGGREAVMPATVDGDRLKLTSDGVELLFHRED
jgi:hypothetical protein